MQSSSKTEQLAAMMNRSPLFDKLRAFGAGVLEKRQIAKLPVGQWVELEGLKAQHIHSDIYLNIRCIIFCVKYLFHPISFMFPGFSFKGLQPNLCLC